MALTIHRIKTLVPEDGKPRRAADGGGLFIEATPAGGKLWKMAYRFGGRQKTLSFGPFPAVSLMDARSMRDAAKRALAAGQDPGEVKKAQGRGGSPTFDDYAGDYILFRERSGAAASTIDKMRWLRAALARPVGSIPIEDVAVPELISAVRAVERTGTLHKSTRMISFVSRVFRFAAAHGAAVMDPGPVISSVALRPGVRHHAAITDPARIGEMLRAIEGYRGDASTRYALMLAPHVFLRDAEIRALRWSWVDDNESVIRIPAGAMKMRRPHVVPISRQASELLHQVRAFSGLGEFVFPSPSARGRPLSSNTLNAALRRLGYDKSEATFHGFRTTASTRLNELPSATRGFSGEAIDMQMSHQKRSGVEAAYNRAELMSERRALMQAWSDALDGYRALPAPR